MSQPSAAEMRHFIERHVELWNAGQKEPWLAHQLAFCAGGLTMEDPVGTPIERGLDLPSEAWDQAFAECHWKLAIEHLFTCGNELAAVVRHEGVVNETPVVVRSIEVYRFGAEGSMRCRTYFDIPEGSDSALVGAVL